MTSTLDFVPFFIGILCGRLLTPRLLLDAISCRGGLDITNDHIEQTHGKRLFGNVIFVEAKKVPMTTRRFVNL